MNNWKYEKLFTACNSIYSGGTPNTKIKEYWNGKFNWLSSGETRNDYIFFTEKTITNDGVNNSSTRFVSKNNVVMASAGQGHTRGQTSFLRIDSYINQSVIALIADEVNLISKYLFYNLKNRYNELRALSDSNSSRGSITTKILGNLVINLPPLPTQRRIAAILSALDDKIDNNRRICETLEHIAQAIFKRWFVDFDFPDEQGRPYKSSGGKMKFSSVLQKEIPEKWKVGVFGDISIETIGGHWGQESEDDELIPVNCLRGCDLESLRSSGNAAATPIRFFKKSSLNNRLISDKDVLIGGSGAGPCGRPLWYSNKINKLFNKPVTYSNFVKRITTKNPNYAIYLDRILWNKFKDGSIHDYITGTSVPNLDLKSLLSTFSIVIPDNKELEKFANISKILYDILYSSENQILQQTRDILLPKLMSGALCVNIDVASSREAEHEVFKSN